MSIRKPYTLKPEAADVRQAHLDTALLIATIMAEANERLFKMQIEAAKATFADNSKHLKALLKATDSAAVLTEWSDLVQTNVRRVLDVTRLYFEILPKTQAEIAKLVGGPFASYNHETHEYLDQLTKTMTDGRDAAAAQMKDFLAEAIESVSAPEAAKKDKFPGAV